MAIKKVARKVARKAASKVKRKGRKEKRVSRKSKKRGRKVKKRSRKSRVYRKRRRSAKKTTSSRKRQARRGRKKKTVEAVVADQEETASEEPVEVEETTVEAVSEVATYDDLGSTSLEAYKVAAAEAGEVPETDSVSGYDLQLVGSAQPGEKEEQLSPEEESVPESREAEAVEPESVDQSAEPTSAPESDYVVINKEDAENFGEDEEESVAIEEPVLANDNLRDFEPTRNEAETESRDPFMHQEDSSSLPSFGLQQCPASSEINTSTSAIPPM